MQPGQQEVEPGSLVRLLAHPRGWDSTEGTDEVSLHTRRRFKGEDARTSQKIDRHLQGLVFTHVHVYSQVEHSFYVHICKVFLRLLDHGQTQHSHPHT
jgi:hypothetical protein